jgi:hypothetical protein
LRGHVDRCFVTVAVAVAVNDHVNVNARPGRYGSGPPTDRDHTPATQEFWPNRVPADAER